MCLRFNFDDMYESYVFAKRFECGLNFDFKIVRKEILRKPGCRGEAELSPELGLADTRDTSTSKRVQASWI